MTDPKPMRVIDRLAETGRDASVNVPPPKDGLLVDITVTQPGEYLIQNQHNLDVRVVYGDGAPFKLSAGDVAPVLKWFVGRIRVYGVPEARVFVRHS